MSKIHVSDADLITITVRMSRSTGGGALGDIWWACWCSLARVRLLGGSCWAFSVCRLKKGVDFRLKGLLFKALLPPVNEFVCAFCGRSLSFVDRNQIGSLD